MNDLGISLLSLLLGAVVGGLAKVLQDQYAKAQESRAVAAALRAEISVLVDGIRRGGYIEVLDRIVMYLSEPDHVVQPDDFLEVPLSQVPFQVFNAHCAQIGLLGDATEAVVKTYSLAETVALDLRFLPERHKRQPLTSQQLVVLHQAIKRGFEEVLRSGSVAVEQLQQVERGAFVNWQGRLHPFRRRRAIRESATGSVEHEC